MSDLLLLPEHRYTKIIEQTRNEDGSELSILNKNRKKQVSSELLEVLKKERRS